MSLVVIADIAENPDVDLAVERAILGPDVDLVHCSGAMDQATLISACREADAVITDLAPMTGAVIAELRRCKLISIAGTGYSNVDLHAVREAGISVCAISEYCTDEVADHVMLLILALARKLSVYQEQVQQSRSWEFRSHENVFRLRHRTLGIIGYGRIGRAIADRARGFGMNLLVHTHHEDTPGEPELDISYCDLPTLLKKSDIVSLSCNMSAENENLIGRRGIRADETKPDIHQLRTRRTGRRGCAGRRARFRADRRGRTRCIARRCSGSRIVAADRAGKRHPDATRRLLFGIFPA